MSFNRVLILVGGLVAFAASMAKAAPSGVLGLDLLNTQNIVEKDFASPNEQVETEFGKEFVLVSPNKHAVKETGQKFVLVSPNDHAVMKDIGQKIVFAKPNKHLQEFALVSENNPQVIEDTQQDGLNLNLR